MFESCKIPFEDAPFALSGRVYGALLNQRSALEAMAGQFDKAPYNAAPRAPVLFVKPRNTLAADGDAVEVPPGESELEVAACLGIVIGRTACRVSEALALDYVAGFLLVNDVSVPHPNYYRPSVRHKARDGFCPLGPRVTSRGSAGNPDALVIRTLIDGVPVQTHSTADLVRSVSRLLADVTEFMTLAPGDVLAAGAGAPAPRARAGQTVAIESPTLGRLANRIVAGAA
jgi:5-oxopent-3-ene-1,2,5-tricarboxylate decarboxylase/2-hydroxyhepta-2,4-diene-1,7-dioate isomerase